LKSTGIARRVDEFGRIAPPIELRKTLGIKELNPIEIYVESNLIYLKPQCVFCGKAKYVTTYEDKNIHS